MALSHTILAFLSEAPHSGYDLSKRFDEAVSCFWKASHQQIYRELAKMEQINWVKSEAISQQGKPNKKLYHITNAGIQELVTWFQTPCSPAPIREDLLVKVLAGPYLQKSLLIQQIQDRRSIHQAQLDCYRKMEQTLLGQESSGTHLKFRYFTLKRGILYEMGWIAWCDEVLAEMEATVDLESECIATYRSEIP